MKSHLLNLEDRGGEAFGEERRGHRRGVGGVGGFGEEEPGVIKHTSVIRTDPRAPCPRGQAWCLGQQPVAEPSPSTPPPSQRAH